VAGISASKLTGKYGRITKKCVLLIKFLTVSDKKNKLNVNIEHTKLKVTVRINPKWPNLDCPSLSGRKTIKISCEHKLYIPWVKFVSPPLRFGRLYYERRWKLIETVHFVVFAAC